MQVFTILVIRPAGYKVADDMMEYILDWDAHNNVIDEDAPVNATAPLYQQIRHLSEVEIDIKTRTKRVRNSIQEFSKDTTTNMLKFLNWALFTSVGIAGIALLFSHRYGNYICRCISRNYCHDDCIRSW